MIEPRVWHLLALDRDARVDDGSRINAGRARSKARAVRRRHFSPAGHAKPRGENGRACRKNKRGSANRREGAPRVGTARFAERLQHRIAYRSPMLIRRDVLEAIAMGRITTLFRTWHKPTVRAGGTRRTP